MNFVKDYLHRSLDAIREMEREDAVEAVANIFLEVEMEMNFLDQRRLEAEERFDYWLSAMMKEKTPQVDPEENFLSNSV